MVTSIGSTSATQAATAPTRKTGTEPVISTTTNATATEVEETSSASTLSAESAASAKLGDQLNAQADAARVQRAVDQSEVAAEDDEDTTVTDADTEAAASAHSPTGGAAPAGGAGGAGGAAASSETLEANYIAEADTNSDKTVSDQERAVYEAKQRQQADTAEAMSSRVEAAYGLDQETEPTLDVSA